MYVLPSLFMHIHCWIFVIIIVCGILDFVGTFEELTKIVDNLKSKFKMKDPRKQKKNSSACRSSSFQTKY